MHMSCNLGYFHWLVTKIGNPSWGRPKHLCTQQTTLKIAIKTVMSRSLLVETSSTKLQKVSVVWEKLRILTPELKEQSHSSLLETRGTGDKASSRCVLPDLGRLYIAWGGKLVVFMNEEIQCCVNQHLCPWQSLKLLQVNPLTPINRPERA